MLCGYGQDMAHIRFTSVARPDGICSICEGDVAVWAEIGDYFHVRVETVYMPWLVVH